MADAARSKIAIEITKAIRRWGNDGGCTVSQLASLTGYPKPAVQKALNRYDCFEKNGLSKTSAARSYLWRVKE